MISLLGDKILGGYPGTVWKHDIAQMIGSEAGGGEDGARAENGLVERRENVPIFVLFSCDTAYAISGLWFKIQMTIWWAERMEKSETNAIWLTRLLTI